MGKTFTSRVAIQQGIEVRDTAGGVHYNEFEDLPGMGSIPAIVLPTVDEKYQERFDNDEASWAIVLAGHWPQIMPKHYVLHGDTRYEVKRASTTKRSRVTTLLAREGSL